MHISQHALARYMERVGAHDVDTAREELERIVLSASPTTVNGKRTIAHSGDVTVVWERGVVVTVY